MLQAQYRRNISRVKKNKPSFQGRFAHLPPINVLKANSAAASIEEKNPNTETGEVSKDVAVAEDDNKIAETVE